jgi:hypothetical protein
VTEVKVKPVLGLLLYPTVLGAASGEKTVTLVDGVPSWVAASDEVGLEAMATRLLADIATRTGNASVRCRDDEIVICLMIACHGRWMGLKGDGFDEVVTYQLISSSKYLQQRALTQC